MGEFMKQLDWEKYYAQRPQDMIFPGQVEAGDEIVSVADLDAEVEALYTVGFNRGLSPGWRSLAELYRIRKREITLITGWPNHGKSCFLDNIMINMARGHGWKWGVFSAENLPLERHIGSLAELLVGKPFSEGVHTRMTKTELGYAKSFLNNHVHFIRPSEHRQSVARILELAGTMLERWQIDAVVLDPWNELDHGRPANLREDEYISVALSMVRWFTRNHDVHFFIVVHPRLLPRENGKFPVPTLRDAKGASEWEAKGDNGLCVWRDKAEDTGKTQIYVQKIRFREVGQTGQCELLYDKVTGRFTDPRPGIDDLLKRQRQPGEDDE
jgi:twinkle protein